MRGEVHPAPTWVARHVDNAVKLPQQLDRGGVQPRARRVHQQGGEAEGSQVEAFQAAAGGRATSGVREAGACTSDRGRGGAGLQAGWRSLVKASRLRRRGLGGWQRATRGVEISRLQRGSSSRGGRLQMPRTSCTTQPVSAVPLPTPRCSLHSLRCSAARTQRGAAQRAQLVMPAAACSPLHRPLLVPRARELL